MTQKLLELTKTHLLAIFRNRSMMIATIAFPLIFITVFGIAMPNGVQNNTTFNIGIIANDSGVPNNAIVFGPNGDFAVDTEYQEHMLSILEDLTYNDGETKVFNPSYYSMSEMTDALDGIHTSSISSLLVLSDDFSLGIMAAFRAKFSSLENITQATSNWENYPSQYFETSIEIKGDPTVQSFSITSSILTDFIKSYFDMGDEGANGYTINLDTDIAVQNFSIFDYMLPGLVIFGLLNNMGVITAAAMRDVDSGILRRLKISKISGKEYTLSLILSQMMVSIIQIPIFFFVASFFGFPLSSSIGYAFIFAIIVSLSVTGLGLLIAGLAKNLESSASLATMITVPMAFLAGVFFNVPNPIIFENVWGGNAFGVMDLIPARSAITALRLLLIGGRELNEVAYQLTLLAILTIIYLTIGVVVYSRKHLSPEK